MTLKWMRRCTSAIASFSFVNVTPARILAAALALAVLPAVARANSVDFVPRSNTQIFSPAVASASALSSPLVVDTALYCGSWYSCAAVNATTFNFALSSGPQDVLHFTNLSGVNWHTLTLTETGVAASNITCSSNLFSCSVMANGSNGARIVLTAFGSLMGVPAGQSFELGFGCKTGGCAAWPSQLQVSAVANLVPEPAAATLLLTGFGLLASAIVFKRVSARSA